MEKKGFIRIGWFLTDICNLRCKHCYHGEFSETKNADFVKQRKTDQIIINNIIELSQEWEIECVGLLGGEPLFHPGIFDYIKKINESINTNITIATNGLLIDDNMISKIKKIDNLLIQISLDSPIKEEHDYYRGEGMYDKTLEKIKKLINNGIYPCLRMTVSDINIDRIEQFIALAKELNVKSVSLNKYVPDRNYRNDCLKELNPVQHFEFQKKINYLINKYGEEFVSTEDPCQNIFYSQEIKESCGEEMKNGYIVGGCSAGLSNITLNSKGDVFPCTILQVSVGNVLDDRLIDIWEGDNKVLQDLRNRAKRLKGKCKECGNLLFCGGCRGAAFKVTGDYLAEDPFCIGEDFFNDSKAIS